MSCRSPPMPGCRSPRRRKTKMIEGLKAVLDGRLRHEDYGDVRLHAARRVQRARARRRGDAGDARPDRHDADARCRPRSSPTISSRSTRCRGSPTPPRCKAAVEAVLRTRLVYEGTRLDLSDQRQRAVVADVVGATKASIKALIATLGRPGWQDEAAEDDGRRRAAPGARALGHDHRQRLGHDRGAASSPRSIRPARSPGRRRCRWAAQTISRAWPLAGDQRARQLPAARPRRRRSS